MKTPEEQAAETNTPAEETTNGVPQPPSAAPAPKVLPMSEEEFRAKNNRRHDLIWKEYDGGGLTEEEEKELERLQNETQRYVEALHPMSFAMIEEAKEIARRQGISLDDFPE
jgi:hypothetical protein